MEIIDSKTVNSAYETKASSGSGFRRQRWLMRLVTLPLVVLLAACGGGGDGSGTGSGGSSGASGGGSTGGGSSGGGTGGGAPPSGIRLQVVSFGDSLSDVGTYAPIAQGVGGGRFVTNPGQVWTQTLAQYYGDQLTAAHTIGFDHALRPAGGMGYAEGGATVATPAIDNDFLLDVIGNVEMPLTDQLQAYLAQHGRFNDGQLVLVWSGANDVLRAGLGSAANDLVQGAALKLADQLSVMAAAGATHLVVLGMPDIGVSPKGVGMSDHGSNLSAQSRLFNQSLSAAIAAKGLTRQVIWVDTFDWLDQIVANYASYGFKVANTSSACDPNSTPRNTALLCSPETLVAPDAAQTYMFADTLHLSTHMNALLATHVTQQIAASGLGH